MSPTGAGPAEGDQTLDGKPVEEGEGGEQEHPEGQQQQETTPQYVTQDELDRRLDQKLERFGNQLVKRVGDSTNSRIKAQIAEYDRVVKLQAAAGHPIPDDAQQAARQAIRTGQGLEEEPPASQPGESQLSEEDQRWRRYIADQLDYVFEDEKMEVNVNDPEWKAIEAALTDPKSRGLGSVLKVAREQAKAKATRIASKKEKASVRVSAGGGSAVPPGDISQVNDPAQLYEMGETQMRKARR